VGHLKASLEHLLWWFSWSFTMSLKIAMLAPAQLITIIYLSRDELAGAASGELGAAKLNGSHLFLRSVWCAFWVEFIVHAVTVLLHASSMSQGPI